MDKSQTCFAHRSISYSSYVSCILRMCSSYVFIHSDVLVPLQYPTILNLCSPHDARLLDIHCNTCKCSTSSKKGKQQRASLAVVPDLSCFSILLLRVYKCLTIPEFLKAKPRTKTTQSTLWTLWKSKQSIGTSYIIQSTYKSWHMEKKIHSNTRKLTRCKTRVRSSLTTKGRKTKNTTMNIVSNNYEQYREEQVLPCAIPPIHYILI